MMKKLLIFLLFHVSLIYLTISSLSGQHVVEGKIIDAEDGAPIIHAEIKISGTDQGTTTDLDGQFRLKSDLPFPWSLEITYFSYDTFILEINDDAKFLRVSLKRSTVNLDGIVIYENGKSIAEKESGISRDVIDLPKFRDSPSPNFYAAAGVLPEVDSPSPSFGFKVINTRGFTSASPVRSLQLIDGVDNQAPGLNFSLGNFLGASDLDVLSIEIIAGAAGAYYGPSAFNGVIHLKSKNPFIHTGLSAYAKAGERNYQEVAVRYADVFQNKKGQDFLAYKLNAFALRANDWRAENYTPVTDSRDTIGNPGRYDAVNIYGDEYFLRNDFRDTSHRHFDLCLNPGLRTFYRTGYKEVDLVDYNTENYKAGISVHLRTQPSKGIESPSIILSGNYGAGTTVYQGDNRFSLKGIQFAQSKIEFSKPDKFFLRAYHTLTDAGKSYDPYFTALRLQELSKGDRAWSKGYTDFWDDYGDIDDSLRLAGYPYDGCLDPDSTLLWLANHSSELSRWHEMAAHFADSVNIREPASYNQFYVPGTFRFDSAFAAITTRLNTSNGGTQFYDHSSLYQIAGEYTIDAIRMGELRMGGNYRKYLPVSRGTIFSDTSGTRIRNSEVGIYAGWKKKFIDQKLIANLVVRADKNQNLKWNVTPAASFVYNMQDRT
ncbi:MAG: carboxypeptidase-like regulatory domain-containing protein, partial [Bacteroidota bacterium]|nr:carboxypeptidase-like regulatory domain-containing protein [Bacteroidota bacterium]